MRKHGTGLWVPLLVVLGSISTRPSAGASMLVDFDGVIETIDDAGGWAAEFELLIGETVDGEYEVDPEAGVVTFGDGRHGARLPSGGRLEAGTYRTGGGAQGNVVVFDDCWIGDRTCVAGQGGDAYFVELTGESDSGVDFELILGLGSTDDTLVGGNLGIPLLPPDPSRFEVAGFRWILTDGVRISEVTGSLASLRTVPEPSTFATVLLAIALVSRRLRSR